MTAKRVAIGCSSGFWGDSAYAAAQLVQSGQIQYLVSDYLAEITMSLLARAKAKSPDAGYPSDFIAALAPLLPEIKRQGIRVVSNAGGMNPRACRAAFEKAAEALGLSFRVAIVEGDDLMPNLNAIRAEAPVEMFSGVPLPETIASCNAYLGARPIATALDQGADVVLTGRCVDSAVTLGILMHEYGWRDDEYDKLASGSLAGHVIECGPQCTGGIFTDWRSVPGWDDMGYPIVECEAGGAFTVTKPKGTGGLVSVGTVAEQIVYEIGDPSAYILPDVVCDFRFVQIEQDGENRVRVTNAKGRSPTATYKVSATYADGWRIIATMMLAGHESGARARRMGEAIVSRCNRLNAEAGRIGFSEVAIEVIGAEDTFGGRASHLLSRNAREVVLKIGLRHQDKAALDLFSREMMQAGVAMAQGTTGVFAGRPSPSPVVRLFSFLIDKEKVPVCVHMDGREIAVAVPTGEPHRIEEQRAQPLEKPMGTSGEVPLIRLAWGRSGDKGNDANIGIIARKPSYVPLLRAELTSERIGELFAHYSPAAVTRWELPGFNAFNFLIKDVLGGGGIASLRYDPQGKTYAQMLMDLPIRVPASILKDLEP